MLPSDSIPGASRDASTDRGTARWRPLAALAAKNGAAPERLFGFAARWVSCATGSWSSVPEAFLDGVPETLSGRGRIPVSLDDASRLATNGLPINPDVDVTDPAFGVVGTEWTRRGVEVEYVDDRISRAFGGAFLGTEREDVMNRQRSFASLAALLLASVVPSSASQSQSGRYGPLALAVRDDGVVHGVFAERRVGNGTPEAPQFGCLFLLEGRMEGERARVVTWFPGEAERIGGELVLGAEPSLQLEENPGGCLMTTGDMRDEPYDLLLDEGRDDWIGVGLVTAERAVLHSDPVDSPGRKRPYLVQFDPVAVLAQQPGWIRVEYLEAAAGWVTGWLRDADVALSAPPGS